MHAIYMSVEDSLRRIANQAFFEKITLTSEDDMTGHPGPPFDVFLNPEVHALALRCEQQRAEGRTQNR